MPQADVDDKDDTSDDSSVGASDDADEGVAVP